MSRFVRVGLRLVAGVVALGIAYWLLFIGFWSVMAWHGAGKWPFEPLERIHKEVALDNGGTMHIDAVEQRGFRSDGYTVEARYQPPGSEALEEAGWWEGYEHEPLIHVTGELIVLPKPWGDGLLVRTAAGEWKHFNTRYPDQHSSFPPEYYSAFTGLTVEEMRAVLGPPRGNWSANVMIKSFNPATNVVRIECWPDDKEIRHARLRLSADGTKLSLIDVKVEERRASEVLGRG